MPRRKTACRIVLVTVPDRKTGLHLADSAITAKLAACGNVCAAMDSVYLWKGKKEKAREHFLLLKTTDQAAPRLIRMLKAHHPYECPAIVSLECAGGNDDYLDWVSASVAGR